MPFIIAIAGAFVTGLVYWVRYGDGMKHIDHAVSDWRKGRRRRASDIQLRSAPLTGLRDPADAAGVLMRLVARQRGLVTPEQEAEILARMREVTDPAEYLTQRMAVIRHAADRTPESHAAITALAPLLRDRLTRTERDDLLRMLQAVAAVHGGPTEAQERLIERVRRATHEAR